MEIVRLTKNRLLEIKKLYEDIKEKTYTLWDEGYPSEDLILWDIEREGLWGVVINEELVAVCFLGERCEDGEENFTWKDRFNKRGTFARIGVSPAYQNKGIATKLVEFILDTLKKQGFDGVRIMVGISNENAIKLYNKFKFVNCGRVNRYNHEYYLYELRLLEK